VVALSAVEKLDYDPRNHTKPHQEDPYSCPFRVISWMVFAPLEAQ
jgi:hypothetical protein